MSSLKYSLKLEISGSLTIRLCACLEGSVINWHPSALVFCHVSGFKLCYLTQKGRFWYVFFFFYLDCSKPVTFWFSAIFAGVMGAVVAPLAFLGGPLLIRAAWYTAGIVGGLSTVAMCAPSEKFLNMGGPLGIGFGFVLASSIGKVPF